MKTRAAVVTSPFTAHMGEVELAEPGAEDIVFQTEYSFISNGTESHAHRGDFPDTPIEFPFAIGYQAAGIVESVGERVMGIRKGDRVFSRTNRTTGINNALGGCHAKTIVAHERDVVPVPDDVELSEASALTVVQVGYNGGSRLPQDGGGDVLILGDGIIGQFTAQAAVARGFRVILAGRHDFRLELARKAVPGIETINTRQEELEAGLEQRCEKPINIVVDTISTPETLDLSINLVPRYGHVLVMGWQGGNQTLDVHAAFRQEVAVYFPAGVLRDRNIATLELMGQKKLRVAPLTTHTFPAEDFAKACELMGSDRRDYLGILIDWR